VVIATKVFNAMSDDANDRGLSRKHIHHAIDDSLRRLGTDYVDLYQIHRFDYETPVEETMSALNDVARAGKALYIGASSMFAWQFAGMQQVAKENGFERFVSMQNHYDQGVGVIPWSPLARGFLAGNRSKQDFGETVRAKTDEYAQKMYYDDSDFVVVDRVSEIARKRGVANAQVALAWVLQQPGITAPIVGASKMTHLDDAIAALDLKLDESELKVLSEPYRPHRVLGHS
jgi:1-deoxyxylulose-5-phosphate synthase